MPNYLVQIEYRKKRKWLWSHPVTISDAKDTFEAIERARRLLPPEYLQNRAYTEEVKENQPNVSP